MALRNPFGEVSCEQEQEQLRADYEQFYFEETPFNEACLRPEAYLIVGRRGCGKTSLSQYFTFQERAPRMRCVDVDEPATYEDAFVRIGQDTAGGHDALLATFDRVWEWIVWSLLFARCRGEDPSVSAACWTAPGLQPADQIVEILADLSKAGQAMGSVADAATARLRADVTRKAQRAVRASTKKSPVVVAIDSLEHYDIHDVTVMSMIAGLVQCASKFQSKESKNGIYLKAFVTAEIFPHLQESVLANPLKHVRDPIFLDWRPKDLLRLVSWRLFHYLEANAPKHKRIKDKVKWDQYDDVMTKVWTPHFGQTVRNSLGEDEPTFPYILRHTQMRPRQLVVICNAVARRARDEGTFPAFTPSQVVAAVQQAELELATEVLNSFSRIYNNASEIVGALVGSPIRFQGKHLDKRAPRTAGAWPASTYSPLAFRRLVAELGMVGRVRKANAQPRIITADFEYFNRGRLELQSDDDCVIHPMFFHRLHVKQDDIWTVYPFPDHPGSGANWHFDDG